MRGSLAATLLLAVANANTVPVYGSYPGWVVGNGKANITVEITIDLTCTDCMDQNPTWNIVLGSPFLGSTVQDQVYWAYSIMPLPYHDHAFTVNQMIPYLQALCGEQNNCILNEYKDWAYEPAQIYNTLSETNVSEDQF